MAIRLNYNPMSVLTHATLSRTDRQMSRVLQRMASGERLQRTAEDPAAMVVANNVRYYRAGVDRVQNNADEAIAMLQTADAGMDQITQTLQHMRTLAISGLSAATTDAKQNTALQAELEASIRAITTMANGTAFGSSSLLNGSLRDVSLSTQTQEYYKTLATDYTKLPGGMTDGATITINPATGSLGKSSTAQNFGPGTPGSTVAVAAPETMVLTGPKGTATINFPAGASIDAVAAAINSNSALTGVVAAYDETTGDLIAESASYGNAALLVSSSTLLAGGVLSPSDQTIDITYIDGGGLPQTVTLTQDATSPGGLTFTNLAGGPEGVAPFTGFAPGAFSLTVLDTSTGGIGSTVLPAGLALEGLRSGTTAFQLGALSSQRVTVEIPDLRSGALGHSAGLAGSDFASLEDLLARNGPPAYAGAFVAGNAAETLALIDAALDEVNRARGVTGALQSSTVERVKDSLSVSSINLREFESLLRDVDMAQESAEYARVQVMMQAATAMLAQANQVPQTVLQLLR